MRMDRPQVAIGAQTHQWVGMAFHKDLEFRLVEVPDHIPELGLGQVAQQEGWHKRGELLLVGVYLDSS